MRGKDERPRSGPRARRTQDVLRRLEELEDRFAALSNKPPPSVLRQQRRERNKRTLAARKVKSTEHQRRLEAIRQEAYDRYANRTTFTSYTMKCRRTNIDRTLGASFLLNQPQNVT